MSIGRILRTVLSGAYDGLAERAIATDPPKVTSGDSTHGDVSVERLEVFTGETAAPLINYVTEIHIFESMVSPVIYCEMFVKDGVNLQTDLGINEASIIRLEFITPGAGQTNEYFFRVNKILDLTHNTSLTLRTFRIQMVSIEGPAAMNVVPEHMEGFSLRDTPGKLIKKILREKIETLPEVAQVVGERRNQRYDIDDGHGIVCRDSQLQRGSLERNRKPFEVIHQMALLADKSPEGDSLYTFFERKDGYYFKPVEKLIRDKKKLLQQGASDAIFYYDHLRNQDQSAVKFRNILAYNILSASVSLTEGRGAAGVNTQAVTANPQTGDNTSAVRPAVDNTLSELTSSQALRQFDIVTRTDTVVSSEYEHLNEVIVKRRQLLSRLTAGEAQIMIYGDSNLSVGDVIECTFPTVMEEENQQSEDTGYYLITHLRHIILNTDRPQHVISCNLLRAGSKEG